jgi:amino acid transporter
MSSHRRLTTFDLTCIGVNAIIGSGIFVLPGKVSQGLGPASILAFLLCGLLCVPLALGYARAATISEASGATYIYGRLAFGERVGFATGWLSWVTAVVSWAAVAVAVTPFLARFVPALAYGEGRPFAVALVLVLGLINVVGVRPGALMTDGIAVVKLVPLALLLVMGLALAKPAQLVPFAPEGYKALGPAMFVALFAYQGFEVVAIPAGETREAARAAPRAVLLAFLISLTLYTALQAVAVMHVPALAGSKTPMVDAAMAMGGATFAAIIGATASISILGFNTGTALTSPRYLSAMAEEGQLPSFLGRPHARFGTPSAAIVVTTVATALLVATLPFGRLVDLSNVSVLLQYLVTMAALVRFNRWPLPGRAALPMPGGVLLPLAGSAVAIYLLSQAERTEHVVVGLVLLAGLVIGEAVRRFSPAR